MRSNYGSFRMVIGLLVAGSFMGAACTGDSDKTVKSKLRVILKGDLKEITHSINSAGLLDEPHYRIIEYKRFSEGKYTAKAVVDFYFFRTINKKIRRKYRYYRPLGMWDRYYNEYQTIIDSTLSK
ncbi:MAG: hypothetical protein GF398_04620 [Chitinivibrionales bacterium]|nr:hypothetical protein [Chitinivibrionales bacterium]